jgi:hypothetical protein
MDLNSAVIAPQSSSAPCPPVETWRDFSHGRLPDEATDDLSEHLGSCPVCLSLVTAIGEENDTIVGIFGQQSAGYTSEPAYQELTQVLSRQPGELTQWSETGEGPPLERSLPTGIPREIDEYRILESLGDGAVGRVFKARHKRLEKIVAIKLLAPRRGLTPDLVTRFEREMRAVGGISHPNVIGASDAGQANGFYFLVMDYLDGVDALQLVARLDRLPVTAACEIVRQAARGIHAAHQNGLIHRDIKPSNLFVTEEGVVKVLDLGLVRLARGSGERPPRKVVGTPLYMAPEQWQGGHVDERTDVYGLGCTLFKLLCGWAPDEGLPHQHPARPPADSAQRRANVAALESAAPGELVALVLRAVSADPDERFASAGELAEALAKWCDGAELDAVVGRAQAFALADTVHGLANAPTVDSNTMIGDNRGGWIWWSIAAAIALLIAVPSAVWIAKNRARVTTPWETKPPLDEDAWWKEAGRAADVREFPLGSRDELIVTTGDRTLLAAGNAEDETYILQTAVKLDSNERAGLYFAGQSIGTYGVNTLCLEVWRKPDEVQGQKIEYVVGFWHLFHDIDKSRGESHIDSGFKSASVYLPPSAAKVRVELRVDTDRVDVLFEGRPVLQVDDAFLAVETASKHFGALVNLIGPYGYYVLHGKVEFSLIRFLDY